VALAVAVLIGRCGGSMRASEDAECDVGWEID